MYATLLSIKENLKKYNFNNCHSGSIYNMLFLDHVQVLSQAHDELHSFLKNESKDPL